MFYIFRYNFTILNIFPQIIFNSYYIYFIYNLYGRIFYALFLLNYLIKKQIKQPCITCLSLINLINLKSTVVINLKKINLKRLKCLYFCFSVDIIGYNIYVKMEKVL